MSASAQVSPDIEKYRNLLYVAAQIDIDPGLQGKLDLSGVIQQTMLEAHLGIEKLRGSSEGEVLAWLRRIMANNLIDAIRKLQRPGYDARFDRSLSDSNMRLGAVLTAEDTPPVEKALRNEELLKLTKAMLQLTEEQRLAVTLHHLQGATLVDVATEMGRTKEAAAGLIHRGLSKLRQLLADDALLSCSTNGLT